MYKLYYSPGACSMAVHVILNELGQKFELIRTSVQDGATKKPEFLKINPRGQVPVLIDEDGTVMKEGGAIISYLLDKHGSPFLPKQGLQRAKALEWLSWCNASLHGAYSKAFWIGKACNDKKEQEHLGKDICAQIQSMWDEADQRLGKGKYLAGDFISGADILMCVIANWNQWMPQPIRLGNNVTRVIKEITARPSYQKALKEEKVEYKAAA